MNKWEKFLKSQRGSITLFVTIVMMLFTSVGVVTYVDHQNKILNKELEIKKVQEEYLATPSEIEDIYKEENETSELLVNISLCKYSTKEPYNIEDWTCENLELKVEFNEDTVSTNRYVKVTYNKGKPNETSTTYDYETEVKGKSILITDNCLIEAGDGSGNSKKVNVTKIDKIIPIIEFTGNPVNWTNKDAILVGTIIETGSGIESVTINGEELEVVAGKIRYQVSENGEYEFIAKDKAGNVGVTKVNVTKIDKENPEILKLTNPTNGEWTVNDVTITLEATDTLSGIDHFEWYENNTWTENGITTIGNTATIIYTTEIEDTIRYRVVDKAGNISEEAMTLIKISRARPNVTITGNPEEWTNQDVTLSVEASDNVTGIKSITVNGKAIDITEEEITYLVTENGTYTFEITNNLGISVTEEVVVDKIDKVVPKLEVTGNPTEWTKEDVTLTIKASDDLSGVESVTINGTIIDIIDGKTTYKVTENGTYTIEVTDKAGNKKTETIVVDKIDKKGPELEVTGNPEEWTKEDVILTIRASDDESGLKSVTVNGIPINIPTGETTYTVTENGTYTFEAIDNVGNITTKEVVVDKIDKKGPSLEVTGNPTEWTKEDVTLTIKASDGESGLNNVTVNGIEIEIIEGQGVYIVGENETYTFEATDNVGNTTTKTVVVDKIDKVEPKLEVTGNPTEWTKEDVILTIKASDDESGLKSVTVNGTPINIPNGETTYTVTENGTYTFEATDNVGNTTTKTIIVDKIDRNGIVIEVTGNPTEWTKEDVTLTVKVLVGESGAKDVTIDGKGITLTDGQGTYLVKENGTYTFVATDNVGNTATKTVIVDKIDKVVPELEVTGNPSEWTKEDVILSLKASDNQSGLKNVMVNGTENILTDGQGTYLVKENGAYTFVATDNVGNTTTKTVVVDKIDKKLPTVELETNGGTYTITPGNTTVDLTTKLMATDTGGSGLNILKYQFSNSTTTPEDSDINWKTFTNESTITEAKSGGTYYLYTYVTDMAGNRASDIQKSNAFIVNYQVTYNANGGTGAPEAQIKIHGTALTLSDVEPTRVGHIFKGWGIVAESTDVNYVSGAEYTYDAAVELYAIWETNSYTVTFDANGGTEASPKSIQKSYGEQLGELPTTTRTGYTFKGWYTAKTEGTKIEEETTMPANDVTYYAQWTIRSYAVIYNYAENGGTSASKTTENVDYNANVDLTVTAIKDGWTFIGWNTNKDAKTKLENYTMPGEDVTLYAIYGKTVTATCYYYDGTRQASKIVDDIMYNKATSVSVNLGVVTLNGYTGRGWSKTDVGNAQIVSDNVVMISEDATFYALYEKTETIEFYYNNAGKQASITADGIKYMNSAGSYVYVSVEIPIEVTESIGLMETTYAGVSKDKNSSDTMIPTTEYTTYYAVYNCEISFYYWNGEEIVSTTSMRRTLANEISYTNSIDEIPTPNAYNAAKFKCWSVPGVFWQVDPNAIDITEFVAWYDETVVLTYDANGGEGAPEAQSGTKRYICSKDKRMDEQNVGLIVSDVVPTKTGYTFTGWNTSLDGTGTSYTAGQSIELDANVTLYAMFSGNSYTITYDNNYYANNLMPNIIDTSTYIAWKANIISSTETDASVINGKIVKIVFGADADTAYNGNGIQKYLSNDLTIGKTYTYSVYLKVNTNRTMRIGPQQGGTMDVNVTTNWQKFTHTFVATESTYTSFVLYGRENNEFSEGDELYVHSLELMEGTPTHITQTKTYGDTLGTLPTPTKTGYTFNGWYTNPTGGTKISETSKVPSKNITYYAQWKDDISPTITVSPTSAIVCKTKSVTITAEDTGSGLSNSNNYQYSLTTNSAKPESWTSYTNGAQFTIGSGLTGTYYLWIRPVLDNAGNRATPTGGEELEVTWSEGSIGKYYRYGTYVFDNSAPNAPIATVRASSTTGTEKGSVVSGGSGTIYSGIESNYIILSSVDVGSSGVSKYLYSTTANGTYTELSSNSLNVTATTGGKTYYLKSKDALGNLSGYTTVTIKLVKMDTISTTRDYIGVTGSTKTATVSVTGSNLGTVTYSSGNTSIATVSSDGVVTAKAAGSVTITARASTDTTVYKQITINVTSLTSPTTSSYTVLEDASITLTAPTASNNAGTITYTSSNTSYATVTSAKVVKGIDIGTAVSRTVTITAKEANGGATCTYTITVRVWATGSGTSSSPYLITNVRDITKLRSKVNSSTASGYRYSSTYFQQTANITLSTWTPIGYPEENYYFSGIYDGNSKTISGISISSGNYIGLFGRTQGSTIENLTVSGSMTGGYGVGGIVGYMINGDVRNCTNKVTITGQNSIGGITGGNWNGTISQCSNTAAINAKDMNITNSEWYANLVGYIGGVAGHNVGSITECYNKGNITVTRNDTSHDNYECVGGIVGYLGQPATSTPGSISHSYNTGKISGYGRYFGGICGDAFVGTISKTYNIGSVSSTKTSEQYIGSIVGPYNNLATITSSYWLNGTASAGYGVLWNSPSTSGIIQRTSAQIKALTSTLGTTYWKDDTNTVNGGYPILKWQ